MKCAKCNVEAVKVYMVFNYFMGCPVCKEEVKPLPPVSQTPPGDMFFRAGDIVRGKLSGILYEVLAVRPGFPLTLLVRQTSPSGRNQATVCFAELVERV